jgi:peptidoglycan-N-acetylglucosamine deacetylase
MTYPVYPDVAPAAGWPAGCRAAASFTFDVDAEDSGAAVSRLLAILDRQDIKATFFISGTTAECCPDTVRAVVDAGHEVGHHGHRNEPLQGIGAAAEARGLDRGLEALWKVAKVRPVGYRAPWWEVNWYTAGLLAERGFRYDSSQVDGGAPYRFRVADGDPRDFVEIPVHRAPSGGEQYALEPAWAAGSCLVLADHPFNSGRPSKAAELERLIERVKGSEGMWVATLAELAGQVEAGRLDSAVSLGR